MDEQFYTLKEITGEEGSFNANVILNTDHSVYKGHFPSQPIAPGVLLMDMCRKVAGSILNAEVRIKEARSIKFVKILDPNMLSQLTIRITFTENETAKQMNCVASWDEDTYFKIIAIITEG